MIWLYRAALWFFPRSYRKERGHSMVDDARQALTYTRERRGRVATLILLIRLCVDACISGTARRASTLVAGLSNQGQFGVGGTFLDIRMARRGLVQNRGNYAFIAVSLSICTGITTAVAIPTLTILNPPNDYHEPEQLGVVWYESQSDGRRQRVPLEDVRELAERLEDVAGVAAVAPSASGALDVEGRARHVSIGSATTNVWSLLGVDPLLGSWPDSDTPFSTTEPSVIISYGLFSGALGADSSIIGGTIAIDGEPRAVAAVLPADFRLLLATDAGIDVDADVWSPLVLTADRGIRQGSRELDQDSDDTGVMILRTKLPDSWPGMESAVQSITGKLFADYASWYGDDLVARVEPMLADAYSSTRSFLMPVLWLSVLVLVVGVGSAATMATAIGSRRRQATATMRMLGGSTVRIARGVMFETLLASVATAVLSALATVWLSDMVVQASGVPESVKTSSGISAAFGIGFLAALVSIGAGLPGALALGNRHTSPLRSNRTVATPPGIARKIIVGTQIAIATASVSMVLVFGTYVLRIVGNNSGVSTDRRVVFDLPLRLRDIHRGPADRFEFVERVRNEVARVPGVLSAAVATSVPLGGNSWSVAVAAGDLTTRAAMNAVSSGYFETAGIRTLAGRPFGQEDQSEDDRTVVVSLSLTERLGLDSPVGTNVELPVDGALVVARIIGVVADVRPEGPAGPNVPTVYVPYRHEASRDISMLVQSRTAALDPTALAAAVSRVDPRVPIHNVRAMDAAVARSVARFKALAGWTLAIGADVLILTTLAMAGMTVQLITSRRREMCIRAALGASPHRQFRTVAVYSLSVTIPGVIVGCLMATMSGRLVAWESGPTPVSAPLLALAVALSVAPIAAAMAIPGYRAVRTNPVGGLSPDV